MYKTAVLALLLFFLLSFPKDCKSSICGNFVSMPNPYLPLSPFTQKFGGVIGCLWQHKYCKEKKKKVALPFEECDEHFECLYELFLFLNPYKGFNDP